MGSRLVNIARAFTLTIPRDGQWLKQRIEAGVQHLDEDVAGHWYTQAHAAELSPEDEAAAAAALEQAAADAEAARQAEAEAEAKAQAEAEAAAEAAAQAEAAGKAAKAAKAAKDDPSTAPTGTS